MSDGANDPDATADAEAFSLLGDPTRLEIVTELHAASDTPVEFSDLYDRVDVGDTGRFNYHRDELVPHFVRRTKAGYELTAAGERIARAVAAGTYTEDPVVDPRPVDGDCRECGATRLVAGYRDERFRIECRDCDALLLGVQVPPSVVRGRDPAELPAAVDRWARAQVDQACRGLCPDCGGPVEPSVAEDLHESIAFDAVAAFDCPVCGRRVMTSFGGVAARDRRVRAFHRERDAALRDRPYWQVPQFVDGEGVDVRSRDPWRVTVTFRAAGDRCRATVDGSLTVTDVSVDAADD
jgi:ribosomal protein S27E